MRLRTPERTDRIFLLLWGGSAIAAILLRPVAAILTAFFAPCGFRALTGLPCLACGTTRAALALLGGHVGEAFRFSPLAALAGTVFLLGGLVAPFWALVRLPVPVVHLPRGWWIVAAVLVVGNWVYLIAAGI